MKYSENDRTQKGMLCTSKVYVSPMSAFLDSLLISSLSSSVRRKAAYLSSLLESQLASTNVEKTGKPFLAFKLAS